MAKHKPTYLWAAEEVLKRIRRPLRARELVSYARQDGYFSEEMHSQTPQKSMQARLSMDILNKGEQSRFVRTGPGQFYLRDLLKKQKSSQYLLEMPLDEYPAPRRTPPAPSEQVLTIPSEHVSSVIDFQGFREDDGTLLRKLLNGAIRHTPRTRAEQTETYKQVVTYVVISYGAHVLSFERGVFNRAADFLRGSKCIGFGGHVTLSDYSLFSRDDVGISENAIRELSEELSLPTNSAFPQAHELKLAGIVNDDSSDVGRRHLGIVLRYEVGDWENWKEVRSGEASINKLQWIDVTQEPINLIEFEFWSQLCWRSLFPVVVSAQPQYRIIRKKPFKERHILVVAGSIGSGKSWATSFLSRNYSYEALNSGKVLASILGLPPVPKTPRAEFQDAAWEFISTVGGPDRLADELIRRAEEMGDGRVIIDGIRQVETLLRLQEKASCQMALLFVHTTPDVAFHLFTAREARGEEKRVDQVSFMKRYSAPVEQEVRYLMNSADVVMYNWFGAEQYDAALSAMAVELGL
jgi:predicted NUDIX family phosphoesterase